MPIERGECPARRCCRETSALLDGLWLLVHSPLQCCHVQGNLALFSAADPMIRRDSAQTRGIKPGGILLSILRISRDGGAPVRERTAPYKSTCTKTYVGQRKRACTYNSNGTGSCLNTATSGYIEAIVRRSIDQPLCATRHIFWSASKVQMTH